MKLWELVEVTHEEKILEHTSFLSNKINKMWQVLFTSFNNIDYYTFLLDIMRLNSSSSGGEYLIS